MIDFLINISLVVLMSSIVIIVVLLTRRLFAKWLSLSIVSILWLIVLARLIIPVTFTSPVTLDNLFTSNDIVDSEIISNNIPINSVVESNYLANDYHTAGADETTINYDTFSATNYNANNNNTEITSIEPASPATFVDNAKALFSSNKFWAVMSIIWMFGAWIVFLINATAIYDFNKKVKSCSQISDRTIRRNLTMGKAILGVKSQIKVYECDFIDTPVTCGFFTPKVLLPIDFAKSIDNNKMYLILLHELSHIKNRDIMKNYLWLFARVVYWFNPLVAIAYKRYLEDIEYFSDNTVLQFLNGQSRVEYTESLLDAVKLSNNYTKVPVALSFCKSKSALRKRVEIMLKPQKKSKLIGLVTIALCIVLIVACFTTACINKDNIDALNNVGDVKAESDDTETITATEQTIETPAPTATASPEIKTFPADNPLKRYSVLSEETALKIIEEVNERLGITEEANYKYQGLHNRGVFPVHSFMTDGNGFGDYNIYEFNGEIQMLQTSAFLTEELGEELSVEELKQNVIDFAYKVYPNTVLTITSCVKDDYTWEHEGVQYESRDYLVDGTLYDNEDGSTRTFTSKIRLDGLVRYVSAEYKGTDYMRFSQEVMDRINSYSIYPDAQMDIFQIDEYYGDYMMHFSNRDKHESVSILKSDMSLVDYKLGREENDIEYSLTDKQIDELTIQYTKQFFPDYTELVIDDSDISLDNYIGEGTITDSRGTMDFYIVLYGDGELYQIGIRPNVDKTTLEEIEESVALQTAIDKIIEEYPFVDENKLEVTRTEDFITDYLIAYKYYFRYISDNPTIYDYSFNGEACVDKYSGQACRYGVKYIPDGLDLITEEEAIQKAKEYIVAEYDLDPDKLTLVDFFVINFDILEFEASFEYPDGKFYGASMFADTGQLDGVGWSS